MIDQTDHRANRRNPDDPTSRVWISYYSSLDDSVQAHKGFLRNMPAPAETIAVCENQSLTGSQSGERGRWNGESLYSEKGDQLRARRRDKIWHSEWRRSCRG